MTYREERIRIRLTMVTRAHDPGTAAGDGESPSVSLSSAHDWQLLAATGRIGDNGARYHSRDASTPLACPPV